MNSRRFILAMAALTAVFCAAMILYNFRTQPPYGQAALTVSAVASGTGVSGTLPAPSDNGADGSSAPAALPSAAPAASRASPSRAASSRSASSNVSFPIHINTASAAELTALPGVGEVIAERIVAYRAANGPFHSIDELDNVKGIGSTTLEKIRPYVAV